MQLEGIYLDKAHEVKVFTKAEAASLRTCLVNCSLPIPFPHPLSLSLDSYLTHLMLMCTTHQVPVHLNMAACQLQTGDFHTAVYNCTEALTMQPDNVKALFRRARARHLLGQVS